MKGKVEYGGEEEEEAKRACTPDFLFPIAALREEREEEAKMTKNWESKWEDTLEWSGQVLLLPAARSRGTCIAMRGHAAADQRWSRREFFISRLPSVHNVGSKRKLGSFCVSISAMVKRRRFLSLCLF